MGLHVWLSLLALVNGVVPFFGTVIFDSYFLGGLFERNAEFEVKPAEVVLVGVVVFESDFRFGVDLCG